MENEKNVNRDELIKKIQELKTLVGDDSSLSNTIEELEKRVESPNGDNPWKRVQLARTPERPGTLEYIKMISDDFVELHGDRCFGDDPALVGGIATIAGKPITFIGHQKGSNLKESIRRNYGSAHPEGYRKALRLARQAEKFGRPIVTFIDTSGAYPGIGSEERGISEAIAVNLKCFSVLRVPVICFVIGEGGSGGALGIGVGDKIYMLENSIYSVISPEGFASILLRDAMKAEYAASIMKLTAKDISGFGIIHGIVPEEKGGVQNNPVFTADKIKEIILRDIDKLSSHHPDQLVRYRSKKIREIGHVHEAASTGQLFKLFSRISWMKDRIK